MAVGTREVVLQDRALVRSDPGRGLAPADLTNAVTEPVRVTREPAVRRRTPAIPALTGIRAVAAIWVVLRHFEEPTLTLLPALAPLQPIFSDGGLGVEVFFVLSGFIISYNYAERFRSRDGGAYRKFLLARAARLYPVHLVAFALVGLLVAAAAVRHVTLASATNYTPPDFLANLLMIQALPPFTGINVPAWSISCETAAYLVFPLLALGVLRLSPRAALVMAVLVSALGIAAIERVGLPDGDSTHPMMWIRIATEFPLGCLLWAMWRAGMRPGRRWDAIAVGAVVGVVVVLYTTGLDSPEMFLSIPLITLFVLCCALARGPVASFLSWPVMQWGGRVSYSLYMTHWLVLMVAKKVLPWDAFAHASLVERIGVLLAYGCAIAALAAGMYHLVEVPGHRLVMRLSSRSTRRAVTTAA